MVLVSTASLVASLATILAPDPASARTTLRDKLRSRFSAISSTTSSTTASSSTTSSTTTSTTVAPTAPSGVWLSGAGGVGVANGAFGQWRGRPADIASTWADNDTAMVQLWQCDPGAEYGSWRGDLDIAIGAFSTGTWADAAGGAYDARWRLSLQNLRSNCADTARTVYIRFAHEMNGNWYPWSVNSGNYVNFVSAWRRFRALQQEIFPASKLVFSVNRESVGTNMDWRQFFPGAAYVDVISVDYYNQYPYVSTSSDFASSLLQNDGYGAPKGLERHRQFAASVGKPLAVSEWSGNADNGDSTAFIQGMHDFFARNAGTGAGNLLYESLFNVDQDNQRWLLYATTRMPQSAAAYQNAW